MNVVAVVVGWRRRLGKVIDHMVGVLGRCILVLRSAAISVISPHDT